MLGLAGPALAGPVHTYQGEIDLPIPANPADSRGWTHDAVINVTDHLVISDLDVHINITHTNVFDLQLFLRSPEGTALCLNMYDLDEFFIGQDYTQTIFDDEAAAPIEQGIAPFTGRFKPRAPGLLEVFDGQDAFGHWRLQVYDAWYADTGTLHSFELAFATPEPATAILLALGTTLITLLNRGRPRP
jgi:subtilisin-like proprotein convertase family protein